MFLMLAVLAVAAAQSADAQTNDRHPTITTPSAQPGYRPTIRGGQPNTVAGTDCPADAAVTVSLNLNIGDFSSTAAANADGKWVTKLDVPAVVIDDTVEEAREWSLNVECGGLRNSLIVTYLDPLARTGPPPLVPLIVIGVCLTLLGAGALLMSRRVAR
ncbi:MAG: hypothetical protein QOI95_3941 [Acidimicrobiaceae bacterium]